MEPREVLEYFSSRLDTIVAEIGELVEIEAPSNDAESSRAVTEHIEQMFRSTGADISVERIECDEGRHLVIEAFGGDGPRTMLLGHTDTVHPGGTKAKNPTRVENGRFYGCGIFDMRSGIVLMVEAIRYFAAHGRRPTRGLTVVLSCDEEVGSFSGRAVAERAAQAAAVCLIAEPSAAGRVKTARKGTAVYEVAAKGVPAHAGLEPERGANAVAELASQIGVIHALADAAAGTTVNVTTFSGGTTSNVIPEHAVCEVDVRFSTGSEAERVDRSIRQLVPSDARVGLVVSGGVNRPPLERTAAVAELYERARGLAATFGYDLGEASVGGGSDGNFIAALGVPVLDGLGVAGDGAHTLDEYIVVDDIARRATLLTLLLA